MNEPWRKTETSDDTDAFSSEFWSRHREDIASGNFWADRIKKYRSEPAERLRIALENLPLPAAFREAAIAVRSLIRACRKATESYDEQLTFLYWLAAIDSFGVPYSERLQEPGYNVVESIPAKILKGLSFSYTQLGYEKLNLLNKTDVKWLVEKWGQPMCHTTLHDLHMTVWNEYEEKLFAKRRAEHDRFVTEIRSLQGSALPNGQSVNRRFNMRMLVILVGAALIVSLFWAMA